MSDTEDLEALKERLAGLAGQVAKEAFGIDLDYSVSSVRRVEEILAELHRDYAQTRDQEGLNGLALEFAAYVIKVIEKNFNPGVWRRNHRVYGDETFPYEWRGIDLFPYGWCLKRILDGPGDNMWTKFEGNVLTKA